MHSADAAGGPVERQPATGRQRPPTIFDVARRAGVSKSLVSLVLRNSPHVSEANRGRVQAAVEELGYRPNAAAQGLARGSSGLIGLLLPEMTNPYFEEIVTGVQDAAEAAGLRTMLGLNKFDHQRLMDWLTAMLEMRVEGLVVSTWGFDSALLRDVVAAVPTVMVGEPGPNAESFDVVNADDAFGARLAVRHLLDLGHRRIAHITMRPMVTLNIRMQGYIDTMREAGLDDCIDILDAGPTAAAGRRVAGELLERDPRPTAVFVNADVVAVGVVSGLLERGVSVPDEMAVVGYDNTLLAQLWTPALTSVHQSGWDIGRLAVEAIRARLDGTTPAPATPPVPNLMVRGSSVRGA